jgi:folate-binding protein YgfZ
MTFKHQFGNPLTEQRNLLAGTAAVNLGPRGIIEVSGVDRLDWLHSLLSQNLKNLTPGQSAEALLLDPQGHIEQVIHFVDDGHSSWLVVEAETKGALLTWLQRMVFRMRVEVADRSAEYAVIGHFGGGVPQAAISNEVPLVWSDPWPGVVTGGVRYSRAWPAKWTYTESLVAVDDEPKVFTQFEPAGTFAYDALRIAAHRPRHITEVDERSLPHELDWMSTAVHMSKGCYRGQETVAKVHNLGHPPRRLVFLHIDGSGHLHPESGDEVFLTADLVGETAKDEPRAVGRVTSVGQHYEMGPIALAVVSRSTAVDAPLTIKSRDSAIEASQETIVPPDAGKAVDRPKIPKLLMGGKH